MMGGMIAQRAKRWSEIDVPEHLRGDRLRENLYKLLVLALSADGGKEHDEAERQELLCDRCGATSCAMKRARSTESPRADAMLLDDCGCRDVLCPHGRNNLRREMWRVE